MFERFTTEAREIVISAQEQARHLGHQHIGTEHLLLGLLARPSTLSAGLLTAKGLDGTAAERAVVAAIGSSAAGQNIDAEALDAIGIDLGAVRERVEATFGEGALDRAAPAAGRRRGRNLSHVPFTKRAKKSLELSLREAIRLEHGYIGDGHLLLGLLREGGGLAYRTIVGAGIDIEELRTELTDGIPPG